MAQQTPLYEQHTLCGARMVDFHGWMMPLHYGSQIDEHHAVRTDAGMFDVSHMTIVDLRGSRTREFLRYLLANDVAKLTKSGKALYSGMLNASGGVIDDLIVYYFTEDFFRLVVNSATREKDLSWITQHAEPFGIEITVRDDLSMIAVQGPNAQAKAATLFNDAQRQAVEGMNRSLACRRAICLLPPPVTPVKRATKLRCPMKKRPISGARWWKLALSHVAWARVTRCVWKRA